MNLIHARTSMRLTQKEAARRLGIDAGNLSRIERGLQQPRPDLARRISMLYGVPLGAIFDQHAPRAAA